MLPRFAIDLEYPLPTEARSGGLRLDPNSIIPPRNYRDVSFQGPIGDTRPIGDLLERAGVRLGSHSVPLHLIIGPEAQSGLPGKYRRSDLHQNRHIELALVTEGCLNIWWEGTLASCPVDSVLVIPARCRYLPHCPLSDQPARPHSVLWIVLSPGGGTVHSCHFEGETHSLGEYFHFNVPQATAITRALEQELAVRVDHLEAVVRGLVSCLLIWLSRASSMPITFQTGSRSLSEATELPLEGTDFAARVESYLLGHYHRPLSLSGVARALGCSPSFLCRRYRQLTGDTPFHRLRHIRIAAAKSLLRSDLPVTRVAEMVGYDDVFYFSRVFSRLEGMSPRAYQKGVYSVSE